MIRKNRDIYRIGILFLLIIATIQIAYAQAPDTLWTRTFVGMAVDNAGNKSGFPNEVNTTHTLSLQQDSLALIALYDSTNGYNWTNNTNWKTGQPLSTWFGITVSGGRVNDVILGSNNLLGTFPTEIGNLTNLRRLWLMGNQLSGSIPPEIGNLTNLAGLDLSGNQFSGSIPLEIGNLTNLNGLLLHTNQFSGSIPLEIGNLTNLTYLHLSYNPLCKLNERMLNMV